MGWFGNDLYVGNWELFSLAVMVINYHILVIDYWLKIGGFCLFWGLVIDYLLLVTDYHYMTCKFSSTENNIS